LRPPQSLLACWRQFLTPQVWKQARAAVPRHRSHPRGDLQPWVMIALTMTWAAGDSQPEKFATARGFYVASYQARKRPGQTIQGFQKALSRLPLRPLQALAAGVSCLGHDRFLDWQIHACVTATPPVGAGRNPSLQWFAPGWCTF
jgi:hypothetical protein